ncbi:MAG: hypothetical protein Q8N17_03535 [Burkholderiaceae bacterium]|nr:hypothetical protein [Burkholderiaceae bacterium]
MKSDKDFIPATYEEIHASYVRRLEGIDRMTNTHHRKIARNYYLHSLLEVAGRFPEIFDPRLTVAHPVYIFHHTGAVFDGRVAVEGFYRAMAESDGNVIYSNDHHFAVADWGFTLEQVSHFYMTAAEYARTTGEKIDSPDAVYVEHRPTMRAWPYDMEGRMKGETLYYAHTATYSKLDARHALSPEGVKAVLAPLIDDAWRDFLANPGPDAAGRTH